jgi:hypothetical protein
MSLSYLHKKNADSDGMNKRDKYASYLSNREH